MAEPGARGEPTATTAVALQSASRRPPIVPLEALRLFPLLCPPETVTRICWLSFKNDSFLFVPNCYVLSQGISSLRVCYYLLSFS